jgi:NAD-specific glutamate dehydrogenase
MSEATKTQLSVVDELKIQINEIKDKIKQGELSDDVFNTLTVGAKVLQGKLDNLLRKGGLYTQSDVNDAYASMQEIKRKNLEIESIKSKYRLYIYLGVAFAVGVGIYLYVKNK